MMMSEQFDKFAVALVAMQADLKHATLDSKAKVPTKTGGGFEYQYASLPEVIDTVRGALLKHGFAVAQVIVPGHVRTMLIHASGQWLASECPIVAVADGPQALGSAITYARRYGLAAIVGIAAEADDDAQAAGGQGAPGPTQANSPTTARADNGEAATDKQRKMIWAVGHKCYPGLDNNALKERLADLCRAAALPEDSRDMTRKQASMLIDTLDNMAKQLPDPGDADDDLPGWIKGVGER